MSFPLLASSTTPPPPPLPTAIPDRPPSLTQRVHIPSHIYKHPTAILLELCTSMKELHQILPHIIKNGLYNEHLFETKLISLFTKYGSLNDATKVFDFANLKVDPMYHTMLKAHTRQSTVDSSLSFYSRLRYENVTPVIYNFGYLLKACADNSDVLKGKQVHAQLILHGFSDNLFAMTSLVNLYAKCGMVGDAYKMFDRMPDRDLVCWNTVIAGYAQNGMSKRALELVLRMQEEGCHRPDSVTVVSILPACAAIGSLRMGKSIHGYVYRNGFESLVNVSTALVDMYAKCGSVGTARLVFDKIDSKTIVSLNAMIDGYARNGYYDEALIIFRRMLDEGFKPTNVTIMSTLHACAESRNLELGQFVHQLVNQLGLGSNVAVVNSLISMYCKCQRVDIAAELFKNLKGKTLVSWNAMILGYAQNGHVMDALTLFCKMHLLNIKPDSFTMVSVVTALAELSVLRQAKWIHGFAIRACLNRNVFAATALVDMYAKCGAVHTARKLFDIMDDRHVTTWNAMIDGYGTHGFGMEAVELFEEMRKGNVKPNDITFLCVISACSHSGFVEKGRNYFKIMREEYSLEPSMDHYGAMVDLVGRAGRLGEAWNFIDNMPVRPGLNVYGAMLGACKIHKNVDLGEKAADKLFELDPDDGGYHVLLANMYATASMWHKVAKVRTMMERKGIQKTPGCSLVDLRNEVHTFYSGSTSHPQSEKIYAYLETLLDRIKAAGYIPDTDSIHDVEDDVQEQLLKSHSEKLAISFGLLNTSAGTTIHIRKNLRVCGDCHSATKYISLVMKREIIVRDMHRFHHFKNGVCSCGDYW
ncbi:pentatricopeptide repeat-containing protein At1g11290, chloroplastic-like [Nicotiana tabacum]|uniref:Pentatricopeptide repeat-containing protein At1g11290, chloroplastic-like n=3 Tax=Nicotiana TaxID=4085 RepID=A0A1S4BGM5_TOBAC|nr:PREDICTED: pentatricopeptide repeat-containing protein At1g11290 [Nicotiana sylvestris]XP_009799584.1 PREDICTED: pentatricopeptide repeat-containing protein At1g11290 [Nicotiana sylvestris]XP_016488011.1 PREDICTED: pentatricopeptide repeat-containing protein At1g11290, chloroplastic-like [Nicotiana tabacum]XP_016488012.1 PREDICTED: pentatricopeptide repeat-containing protein At1g11290, chloroplastic-like [Nicotiana tabacum]